MELKIEANAQRNHRILRHLGELHLPIDLKCDGIAQRSRILRRSNGQNFPCVPWVHRGQQPAHNRRHGDEHHLLVRLELIGPVFAPPFSLGVLIRSAKHLPGF